MEPSSFEGEYPELFETLSPAERLSVSFALQSSRLSVRELSRDGIALLIRSVTQQMSAAEYEDAVVELSRASTGVRPDWQGTAVGLVDELDFEDGDLPLDDADYLAGLERLRLVRSAEKSVRELPPR